MSDRKPALSPVDVERIETLERAAEHYEQKHSPLKAIAACKRILLIDPDHPGTRERIDDLCNLLHGETARPIGNEPVALGPSQPLDDLVLQDVLVGTPDVALDDDLTVQPMVEIELDWTARHDDEARRLAADTLPRTPLFSCLDGESLRALVEGARLASERLW